MTSSIKPAGGERRHGDRTRGRRIHRELAVGPAPTEIDGEVPVIELVEVSVAVMVWPPATVGVSVNVPVPDDSGESAGRLATPSELVK